MLRSFRKVWKSPSCNAPGVVGVESDAGNRECEVVLFNVQKTQHRVLTTKIYDQEHAPLHTKQKVTIINPSQRTRRAG